MLLHDIQIVYTNTDPYLLVVVAVLNLFGSTSSAHEVFVTAATVAAQYAYASIRMRHAQSMYVQCANSHAMNGTHMFKELFNDIRASGFGLRLQVSWLRKLRRRRTRRRGRGRCGAAQAQSARRAPGRAIKDRTAPWTYADPAGLAGNQPARPAGLAQLTQRPTSHYA